MRRSVSLRVQLLALQLAIVLVTVLSAGGVVAAMQAKQIRDGHRARMIAVAESVARLPTVIAAYDDPNPSATIQPLAELIRKASSVTYVVVTDEEGIRYSHPVPERIGKRVSTDPSVPLSGEMYVGTQTGTLGRSWRVKVPVFDEDGSVMGIVSVGVLESELRADLLDDVPTLLGWLAGAAVLGTLGAAWVTRHVRRRIFRLEPDQIATLLEARDATLHGIREGVIALDTNGQIALINDEARRLLVLDAEPTGQPADQVLEPSLAALATSHHDTSDQPVLAGVGVLVVNRRTATSDGREVGAVLTLRDRTELDNALRELDGQRTLTEALRAQAHEFSNHMHVVSGLLELGRTDDAVSFIQRISGGGTVSPSALARIRDPSTAALLLAKAATCRERDITFQVRASSPDDVETGADADADRQRDDVLTTLGNLIDNAIDAAGHGGTIDVGVDEVATGIHLYVADDGPGVQACDRERIFAAGFSSKPASSGSSRGIGLALVKRIVVRCGGQINVGDGPFGGAVFQVWLPRRPAAHSSAARPPVEASR